MNRLTSRTILAALLFGVLTMTSGCTLPDKHGELVYSEFYSPAGEQWGAGETVTFRPMDCDSVLCTVHEGEVYELLLSVRYSMAYPRQKIWLALETESLADEPIRRDTVALDLMSEQGSPHGRGVHGLYTVSRSLGEIRMPEGWSLTVSQAVQQEPLPGINKVGCSLIRK